MTISIVIINKTKKKLNNVINKFEFTCLRNSTTEIILPANQFYSIITRVNTQIIESVYRNNRNIYVTFTSHGCYIITTINYKLDTVADRVLYHRDCNIDWSPRNHHLWLHLPCTITNYDLREESINNKKRKTITERNKIIVTFNDQIMILLLIAKMNRRVFCQLVMHKIIGFVNNYWI